MQGLRVIIVDDEPATCAFLQAVLASQGHDSQAFYRAEEAEAYLAANHVDMALVDVYLGSTSGLDLLKRARALQPSLYAVVMTAHVTVETAARSAAEGAIDYVSKPITVDQILALTVRAGQFRAQEAKPACEAVAEYPASAIIGRSPKMLEVYNAIARVAQSSAPVLITGASGTGKELVARAIHQHSRRAGRPFTPVNCGSLTETLLETELFGHERGAFTGAANFHKGLIEATDGGTLFLDEVTETTLGFQVKLLRVLQEQQVRRVGSSRYVGVDVRVLAASNRDLPALIAAGQFREDLYYRLSVVRIQVPPLNERREDIALLVAHFLQQFNAKNEAQTTIDEDAVERLRQMDWPGNVRELENAVNRLAIFAAAGHISATDVARERERACGKEAAAATACAPAAPDRLREVERLHIARVLKEAGGNKAEAARRLGIERKSLYKKALRLGIDLRTDRQ